MHARISLPVALCFAALSSGAFAQCPDEIAKLTYPLLTTDAEYGDAVAIDGTVVVVGDKRHVMPPSIPGGAAFVYERDVLGAWVLTAVLQQPLPETGSRFGTSVAVDGDQIVVGAPQEDAGGIDRGAAYTFARNSAGQWVFEAKLLPSIPLSRGYFGEAVGISGSDIIIGQPSGAFVGDQGLAFVYEKLPMTGWTETQVLTPDNLPPVQGSATKYGAAVAIDGNYIIVGQEWDDPLQQGRAEVWRRDMPGLPFTLQSSLSSPAPEQLQRFGLAVDIDAATATALIGATTDAPLGIGSAYVFTEPASPGPWTYVEELTGSDSGPNDIFGWSVALEGDTALIGSYGARKAYEFRRTGGTFTEHSILEDPPLNNAFGRAVALSGGRGVVGDPTPFGYTVQAAHVFGSMGQLGTNYGPLTVNTSGSAAAISASGTTSIANNNLTLSVTGCPPGVLGRFIFSDATQQVSFSNGFKLVGPPSTRIPPGITTDTFGNATLTLDLSAAPFSNFPVAPGMVLYFQFWFRDGPTGTNFSDALRVTLCN